MPKPFGKSPLTPLFLRGERQFGIVTFLLGIIETGQMQYSLLRKRGVRGDLKQYTYLKRLFREQNFMLGGAARPETEAQNFSAQRENTIVSEF